MKSILSTTRPWNGLFTLLLTFYFIHIAQGQTSLSSNADARHNLTDQREANEKPWRNAACGWWIYSPTETIPTGYYVTSVSGENLGPLATGFSVNHWNRRQGHKPETFYHAIEIHILAGESKADPVCSMMLIDILHRMIFIEDWRHQHGDKEVQKPDTQPFEECGSILRQQDPSFFDEAIHRLHKHLDHCTVVDIYIEKFPWDIYFYVTLHLSEAAFPSRMREIADNPKWDGGNSAGIVP